MSEQDNLEKRIRELEEELAALKRKHSFVMTALDNLPNPIFIKDEELRFFFFNQSYSKFFGMEPEKYFGTTVLDLDYLPMEDRVKFNEEDARLMRQNAIKNYTQDFLGSDGEIHPSFYWSRGVLDESTGARGIIGEIVDITDERNLQLNLAQALTKLRDANEKLEKTMEIDAGTGIYNRVLLNRLIGDLALRRTSEYRTSCALLCDLDHFKRVNDTFGHLKGDAVLTQFAEIIKSECRSEDMPIRYGGDEFLLLLHNATGEVGIAVAERIRERCEAEITLPDGSPITVSVGVAPVGDSQDLEGVISKLDDALYKAKEQGRNRVVKA